MLRSYVETKEEWEKYLPLVLYAYHTAVHSSIGFTPFELMYGRPSQQAPFDQLHSFDADSYQHHLQAKLAEMRGFVEINLAGSASRQSNNYNKHSQTRQFKVGDHIWLSIPTAKKLDPKWDGRWTITAVKGPLNMQISDGTVSKVVHVNRLRHQIQPTPTDGPSQQKPFNTDWTPPQIDHFTKFYSDPIVPRRYPSRACCPPLRYTDTGVT